VIVDYDAGPGVLKFTSQTAEPERRKAS
jgi:hypothetical protein